MTAQDLTDESLPTLSTDSLDFELTLEDQFTLTRIQNELKAATDIEQLRTGAALLLNLAVMRQAMIRGLINRVGALEQQVIRTPRSES
jgi:hypothetical protein